jgi:hypothetical protein
VLALRNLGLGLESIAVCLDAGVDPARLVVRAASPSPTAARALARHLEPDQLAVLRDRAEALGPLAHYLLEVEWPAGGPVLRRRPEALRRGPGRLGRRPRRSGRRPGREAASWRALAHYLDLARRTNDTKEQEHA